MSRQIAYIGERLREVRERAGHSQSKVAAMLDLSDRAYKNYELGKREPPLGVVAKFSTTFEADLNWLVFGEETQPQDTKLMKLAADTSDATYALATKETKAPLSLPRYSKFFRYVLEQSLSKGTSPKAESEAVYELMREPNG